MMEGSVEKMCGVNSLRVEIEEVNMYCWIGVLPFHWLQRIACYAVGKSLSICWLMLGCDTCGGAGGDECGDKKKKSRAFGTAFL